MELLSVNHIQYNQHQFDLNFQYLLKPGTDRKHICQVDTFFFIPNNMGVTPENYSKEMFFSNMQRHFKYKIAIASYRDIFEGTNAPLRQFEFALSELAREYTHKKCKNYADRLRIFCSVMRTTVIDDPVSTQPSPEKNDASFNDILTQILETVSRFRRLKTVSAFSKLRPEERKYYCYADEFLSLCLNEFLCAHWCASRHTSSESEDSKANKDTLWNLIQQEQNYRFENQYRSGDNTNEKKSERLYWERILKKTMASVLFLRPQRQKNGFFIENFFLCISAGIAMMFATGIAFAWKWLYLDEFSFSFFAIWVFAYMGKDRIKEFLRFYFQNRLRYYIHDYKTVVRDAFGNHLGCCLESMMFVEDERKLDREILRVRNRSHITALEHDSYKEHVIAFSKQLELHLPKDLARYQLGIDRIIDNTRYNIGNFLKKLDEPLKKIFIPTGSGSLTTEEVTRVYHLNAVIRYGGKNSVCNYLKLRLILTRNGIKKILLFPDIREKESHE